jgi:hypothetical protein
MPALKDLLPVVMLDEDTVENWMRRTPAVLGTTYAPGVRGRPRELSRENALELGFLAALRALGFDLTSAGELAARWIEEDRRGTLRRYVAVNPLARKTYAYNAGQGDTFDEWAVALPNQGESGWRGNPETMTSRQDATVIARINLGALVERIDALFAQEA